MERLRNEGGTFRAQTYEVTVWNNTNGDIDHYVSEATDAELSEIEENYYEPIYSVQVERND